MWDLGALPLQVGARIEPSNAPLPDTLPMRVEIDPRTGRVVQRFDPAVADVLGRAYAVGSPLGTPLADSGLGKPGLDDFLGFVLESRGSRGLQGARVLEIGAGEGALLAALVTSGATGVGVEPGAEAAVRARARGLTVVEEPFSAGSVAGPFDLIVHHAVLEHISEPVAFLAEQLSLLSDGGLIVCSVPDCSEPIARGDVSMFMHEHWSYFTPASLMSLAQDAGATLSGARSSSAAGAFYSAWRRADGSVDGPAPQCELSAGLRARAERGVEMLHRWLAKRRSEGATVGVYCPPRFLNYQALIGGLVAAEVRFFDDDPGLAGRYLPPVAIPIEPRDALIADPVDQLLVMSWTFGRRLREALGHEPALARTRVSTLDEVLAQVVAES
jgi:2-polyprenyl-3-methyl-5-hydroxy-6-metoxy-1,4-benzoquinol methylase